MKLVRLLTVLVWCARGEAISAKLKDWDPDFVPNQLNPLSYVFQNKCIEDLGCFYTGPPFYDPINRPISLPPTDNLTVRFYLFSPTNPHEKENLDTTEKSIENSSLNPQFPLELIIHGFIVKVEENGVPFQTKDTFLKSGNYNVLIMDWTDHNGRPYAQAVANTRVVGAYLAKFLKVVMKVTGLKSQDIHLIGHSLGAHVAGYAGERIQNLGRITGLDPAAPFFEDTDPVVRLDPTDADFVDVIHTNGGVAGVGLGDPDPIGHMDFYPNGGTIQPGCVVNPTAYNNTIIDTGLYPYSVASCSHSRATYFFKESIDNSKCHFLAVLCTSYPAFEKGVCPPQNSTVSEMGFHSTKIKGLSKEAKFYLRTKTEDPYCSQNSI